MKKTLLLLLFFVALVIFVYYEYKGGLQREDALELASSLLKIEKEDIESVSLIRRGEVDTVVYTRAEDDNWRIISPITTQAENSATDGNISAFVNAQIKKRISIPSEKLKNFGLDPQTLEVIIKTRDNRSIHINIGDDAAVRGDLFVALAEGADSLGSDDFGSSGTDTVEVFVTSTTIRGQVEKSLFDLRDKKIAHFDSDQVRKVELTSPEGMVVLEKSEVSWSMVQPRGVPVDDSRIRSFFSSVKNYTAKEFARERFDTPGEFGFENPTVKLSLALGQERATKEIVIGKKLEDEDSFYGYESGRSPVFVVREATKKSMSKAPFYFQDKKIVKFDENEITQIRFSGSHQLTLAREDTLEWYAHVDTTTRVDSTRMATLFTRFRALNARELVTYEPDNLSEYGLYEKSSSRAPFLEAVIANEREEIGGFVVGDTVETDRYIKNRTDPFVYRISSSQVKRLTDWLENLGGSE